MHIRVLDVFDLSNFDLMPIGTHLEEGEIRNTPHQDPQGIKLGMIPPLPQGLVGIPPPPLGRLETPPPPPPQQETMFLHPQI